MSQPPDPGPSRPAPRTRRRGPLTIARRLGNAALGAASTGAAAWLVVWFADAPADAAPWCVRGIAPLGAALGFRYGRRVVGAAGGALFDTAL